MLRRLLGDGGVPVRGVGLLRGINALTVVRVRVGRRAQIATIAVVRIVGSNRAGRSDTTSPVGWKEDRDRTGRANINNVIRIAPTIVELTAL